MKKCNLEVDDYLGMFEYNKLSQIEILNIFTCIT